MKKIFLSVILFSFFVFCGSKKNIDKEKHLIAIKFMGTITTFPVEVNEQIFWEFPKEHVSYSIDVSDDIIGDVKKLPINDGKTFTELKYAFLVKNNKGTRDTIYADYNLKTWRFIDNGNNIYRYDKDGILLRELSLIYSFFEPCW